MKEKKRGKIRKRRGGKKREKEGKPPGGVKAGEPLLKNLLEFKKRDFGSGVMEPRPEARGGKPDIVIIPKSLGILIFQGRFPRCGRGPPRLPRYKTLRVFPGVGSGRRGQRGFGGWVSGENNRDFLPRDFSRWGFWGSGCCSIRSCVKSRNIRGAPRGISQRGGGCVFMQRVGKAVMTIPKFQCRDGKAPGLKNISGWKASKQG